jgi:hypothetical protein
MFTLTIWLVGEVSIIAVCGVPIPDKLVSKLLEENMKYDIRLNEYNSSIIYIGGLPYIAKAPFKILFPYYIEGLGVVPRWSKSYKLIKKAFTQELINNGKHV